MHPLNDSSRRRLEHLFPTRFDYTTCICASPPFCLSGLLLVAHLLRFKALPLGLLREQLVEEMLLPRPRLVSKSEYWDPNMPKICRWLKYDTKVGDMAHWFHAPCHHDLPDLGLHWLGRIDFDPVLHQYLPAKWAILGYGHLRCCVGRMHVYKCREKPNTG